MFKGAGPFLAAISIFALAACDTPSSRGEEPLPPPGSGSGAGGVLPPEDELLLPPAGEAVEGEVYSDGDTLVVKEAVEEEPDVSSWLSGTPVDEQRRLDMEACYDYARAQVRRDEEIYADQNAGWSNINNDSRYAFLKRQQTNYGFQRRRDRLFSSCMESKGYDTK